MVILSLLLPLQPLGVANELLVVSGLIYRWWPKGSEHLQLTHLSMVRKTPHGKLSPLEDLQSSCLWLGRRHGLLSLQLIPHQCIPVAQLSTQTPFHSHTHHHKHFNPLSAAVGGRALPSEFTAHQLQTTTKTEPKALPTFWPSLLSGCEMWLALISERLQWQKPQGLSHRAFLTPRGIPDFAEVLLIFSSHS